MQAGDPPVCRQALRVFIDELYYLACSRHLAWGYVDQPPLIAAIVWLVRITIGQSLPAIRLLPALAGATLVAFTGIIARELGGGRFAQGFAALAAWVAPGVLVGDAFLTMNAFEPLFWMGCGWLVVRMVKTGNTRLWICFGVLAGIGLENKYSMALFAGSVVLGLLLTRERRLLASRWLWVGGAIAFLLFLPNLLWNIHYHFSFLELQASIRRSGRDVPLGPAAFFAEETLAMQPLALPLWLGGLWFYFANKAGKPFRTLGWAWLFTAATILAMSPRVYYLFPAFSLLFAAGGVWWEGIFAGQPAWRRLGWPALVGVTGVLLAPITLPLLPPETYIRYSRALHVGQPAIETHKLGPLPQLFADQFGWEEMTATVARVYNGLPPDVRPRTAVFSQNYGQAGAIDLFGPKYGLPLAISGHQTYFLWGPRDYTGDSMIVMAGRRADLERRFASVEMVARVSHPYSMPYEHFDVYYCRDLKQPLRDVWPRLKNWD